MDVKLEEFWKRKTRSKVKEKGNGYFFKGIKMERGY
jgi:hypothetical protein